ncbi:MAG: ATP-binding protein [Treponema sp.]
MFKGRKKELELLEDLYGSKQFEFLVLYGRRRVGKTELLKEFTKNKKTLIQKNQSKKTLQGKY